jgi:acetyl esterase/lipase
MALEPIDLDAVLDAEHRAALATLPPDLFDLTDIAAFRSRLDSLTAVTPLPDGVTVEDAFVPGRFPDDPAVRVRIYRPTGLAPQSPAILWFHGGGMVSGTLESTDLDCATRAARLRCLVVSVEYRLAPEHRFPAPLDDCYGALTWLAAHAVELGVDPNRIAVGGQSAGGGLAAGTALLARDSGGPALCFQVLVYPMLDHRNTTPSSHAIVDTRAWCRSANLIAWDAYLGEVPEVSPYASPAVAADLAGLPPAYVNVGTFDLFLDENIAYARSLLAAGVPTELHVYPGAFHASPTFVPGAALSRRWRSDERVALEAVLHPK